MDTELPGVKVITPVRHGDAWGFFSEIFRADVLAQYGIERNRSLRWNDPALGLNGRSNKNPDYPKRTSGNHRWPICLWRSVTTSGIHA